MLCRKQTVTFWARLWSLWPMTSRTLVDLHWLTTMMVNDWLISTSFLLSTVDIRPPTSASVSHCNSLSFLFSLMAATLRNERFQHANLRKNCGVCSCGDSDGIPLSLQEHFFGTIVPIDLSCLSGAAFGFRFFCSVVNQCKVRHVDL